MSYPIDQPIRLTFDTFSDAAQTVPADPTTLSLDVRDPAAVVTTYTWAGGAIVRDSIGVFHYDATPTVAGHYVFHWKAAGAVATAQDGSFDVDAEYTNVTVSQSDFSLYLNNPAVATDPRARFILDKAQQLCETVVKPLPSGSDIVILDVAERAYANPTNVHGSIALYSEGEGPFSDTTPGTTSGGLWLTDNNTKTLRRLAGIAAGAFTIDTLTPTFAPVLPIWDTANVFSADWDTPP